MKSTGRRRKASARRRNIRPEFVTLAALLVVASVVAGSLALTRSDSTGPIASTGAQHGSSSGSKDSSAGSGQDPEWDGKVRVIGDGSTSYTGPQKGLLKPKPLKPGEKPPQFVVFSWDGALEGSDQLFSHYRQLSKQYDARMTFFLTGIYLLPKHKRHVYDPPKYPRGAAAIDYPTEHHVRTTLEQLRKAYEEGHEIGTHFNGHFCGPKGGGDWSVEEWKQEIDQFFSIVTKWKTHTGFTDVPPLPFDFKKEVIGGRAPCLEGQPNLLKAIKDYGWRYDSSSPGDFQIWPRKKDGIWDFPLQMLPYENGKYQGLSMDFNFLYNQSGGDTKGDPAKYPQWEEETVNTYMAGFNRVYYGSRAPLFIGNHFEQWNGGIYMRAVDRVIKNVCPRKDVKCVSFRELADWLDVQKPETLQRLRSLDPAQSPDWSSVVK